MNRAAFNWQQAGWPQFTFARAALREELDAFARAFREAKKALAVPEDPETVARTLTAEAVTTSAIEGVEVDESAVMSSICRALGVPHEERGGAKDARAEGVARLVLSVRSEWNAPLSARLVRRWHGILMEGDRERIAAGAFRAFPVRVVRITPLGETETRFEAPPPERVAGEMARFVRTWNAAPAGKSAEIALKAAFMHPHFESIHPFEDGNGRIGRALVAKTLSEGLGVPVALPVSTLVARHRRAYYDELAVASRSLDWTGWGAFFVSLLTELLDGFVGASRFVTAKREYLGRYDSVFSERARKVVLRMFEDGETGARAGLSAAKWMRMAKVSKPTATRDLGELAAAGAIVPQGGGPQTRYYLNHAAFEPIEGINEGINDAVRRLVENHPGRGTPFFRAALKASRASVERAVAALVAAGAIEHRGSRKSGGYWPVG
jgi:Fic family protein